MMQSLAEDASAGDAYKAAMSLAHESGLYLFYNEQAFFGIQAEDPRFALCIRNERNKVSLSQRVEDGEWVSLSRDVDVSSFHHNNYNGFFALRPAYLLCGDAALVSFEYKPL